MSKTWIYVLAASGLIVFGIVGLFSVGAPFLLTGLVMLLCLPWRRNRAIVLPALSAVWAFTLGYVLVAPLGCTSSGVAPPREVHPLGVGVVAVAHTLLGGATVCNGALFDYSGGGSHNPPLLPAVLVGMAAALVTALAVWAVLRNRSIHAGT